MDLIPIRISEGSVPTGAFERVIVVSSAGVAISELLERMSLVRPVVLLIDPRVTGSAHSTESDVVDLSAEALQVVIPKFLMFPPETAAPTPARDSNFWFKGRKRRKGWRPWY